MLPLVVVSILVDGEWCSVLIDSGRSRFIIIAESDVSCVWGSRCMWRWLVAECGNVWMAICGDHVHKVAGKHSHKEMGWPYRQHLPYNSMTPPGIYTSFWMGATQVLEQAWAILKNDAPLTRLWKPWSLCNRVQAWPLPMIRRAIASAPDVVVVITWIQIVLNSWTGRRGSHWIDKTICCYCCNNQDHLLQKWSGNRHQHQSHSSADLNAALPVVVVKGR